MTAQWDVPTFDFDAIASDWAGEQAEPMAQAVRDTIPVKTTKTQSSIEGDAVGPEIHVSGSKVADYLRTGTPEHEIHGSPWLVFEGRDGETVFLNNDRGKFVHHPGTGPDPYIENAIDAKEQDLIGALLDRCTEAWSS